MQVLLEGSVPPFPDELDLSPGVRLVVEAVGDQTAVIRQRLRSLHPANTFGFYLRELQDPRDSTFRFALRMALTRLICRPVDEHLIADVDSGVPFHGFWTLRAGRLMATPDFHGTSGKAIARTSSSILVPSSARHFLSSVRCMARFRAWWSRRCSCRPTSQRALSVGVCLCLS